jgi:hypothetical protein
MVVSRRRVTYSSSVTRRPVSSGACLVAAAFVVLSFARLAPVRAAGAVPPPEQFIGFAVGTDNKLARWDKIVEYMKAVAATSERVAFRELGKSTSGNPFIVVEISAPDVIANRDRFKELERKLYFQGGAPSARDRDEIFRQGKAVVLITCSVHATEIGATQMSLELVHRLATDDSPAMRKMLDNVIVLLVPSLNPDGQILVTDWFNRNLGTAYENSPLPYLYHPYAGHDNNRDMYLFTQKESQYAAELAWHDWLPTIWLDEHQMGPSGPRIFVMPATDPINPNVHPLIYRWNTILGQSQAAALEAAGKDGIIYNSTYTNFWQGAMAWSGWWHNQIGLLTEVASARVAAPIEQLRAITDRSAPPGGGPPPRDPSPLASPSDITPRTEYPRPWLGGRWTLRDIVDYQLISTMALIETASDRRETLLRQIYEINRQTVETGRVGDVTAIVIPAATQHDSREAAHLVDRLDVGGVEVYRTTAPFEVDNRQYDAGAFVIPMSQVFARYAKDLLEKQVYPEVRTDANSIEPPYDVTAWSLGMLFGVDVSFLHTPLPPLKLVRVHGLERSETTMSGRGTQFSFGYSGPDTAIAINRLLDRGAHVAFFPASQVRVSGVARNVFETATKDLGLKVTAGESRSATTFGEFSVRPPRIALYSPWTGGNIDEGWTRWVLEQYGFHPTTVHNEDLRTPKLRQRFDAIILADQNPREIVDGLTGQNIRPEYRGGIGETGVDNLQAFVADGGTLIALGTACDLVIDRFAVPVQNIKRGLRREEHFAPGAIVRIQVNTTHPLGAGMASESYGFYNNSPFFSLTEPNANQTATAIARYPDSGVLASGWLKGEFVMAGRAATVSVEMNPGRIVLFGLRPQHRAQTHATFPLLFNALYLATSSPTN